MIVTYRDLGKVGRLGNQLFQIASTIGIALENKRDYCFPEWRYASYFPNQIFQANIETDFDYYQVGFDFYEIELPLIEKINLRGYYQSERWFKKCENIIRNLFVPKFPFKENDCVAVHVRRGDYLQSPDRFVTLDLSYYKKATDLFSGRKFRVFSDDIEWCKDNLTWADFEFMENMGDIDLFRMSACKDFIIANSTYSWWGAWLGEKRGSKIVAPKEWFGPELEKDGYCTDDLIPDRWIEI